MLHYICIGGCQSVSKEPGVCTVQECSLVGHPLLECNCIDGEHFGAFNDLGEEQEDYE